MMFTAHVKKSELTRALMQVSAGAPSRNKQPVRLCVAIRDNALQLLVHHGDMSVFATCPAATAFPEDAQPNDDNAYGVIGIDTAAFKAQLRTARPARDKTIALAWTPGTPDEGLPEIRVQSYGAETALRGFSTNYSRPKPDADATAFTLSKDMLTHICRRVLYAADTGIYGDRYHHLLFTSDERRASKTTLVATDRYQFALETFEPAIDVPLRIDASAMAKALKALNRTPAPCNTVTLAHHTEAKVQYISLTDSQLAIYTTADALVPAGSGTALPYNNILPQSWSEFSTVLEVGKSLFHAAVGTEKPPKDTLTRLDIDMTLAPLENEPGSADISIHVTHQNTDAQCLATIKKGAVGKVTIAFKTAYLQNVLNSLEEGILQIGITTPSLQAMFRNVPLNPRAVLLDSELLAVENLRLVMPHRL